MKTFQAELSKKSLNRLARDLKEYSKKLRDSTDEIVQKLSAVAAAEASKYYSGDVSVAPNGHGVTAVGESVVFEEFGAGARISDPFPGGADVSFEIRRGAYSEMVEGEYWRTGYELWHHDGEEYRFINPGNGLFYGKEEAEMAIPEVCKEVLDSL